MQVTIFIATWIQVDEGKHISRTFAVVTPSIHSRYTFKQSLRQHAEGYQMLRRDTLNLVNLHIHRSLENGTNANNFPPIHLPVFWTNAFALVSLEYRNRPIRVRMHSWTKWRIGILLFYLSRQQNIREQQWYIDLSNTYHEHYQPCRQGRVDKLWKISKFFGWPSRLTQVDTLRFK